MFERKVSNINIIGMVQLIKSRPEMFFGEKVDAHYLYYYLLGSTGSRIALGVADSHDERYQWEFGTWIYQKFNSQLDHDMYWAKAVSIIEPSPAKQIELFYELFGEFFGIRL